MAAQLSNESCAAIGWKASDRWQADSIIWLQKKYTPQDMMLSW